MDRCRPQGRHVTRVATIHRERPRPDPGETYFEKSGERNALIHEESLSSLFHFGRHESPGFFDYIYFNLRQHPRGHQYRSHALRSVFKLLYVIRGLLTINDGRREIQVKPGRGILIRPMTFHSVRSIPQTTSFIVMFGISGRGQLGRACHSSAGAVFPLTAFSRESFRFLSHFLILARSRNEKVSMTCGLLRAILVAETGRMLSPLGLQDAMISPAAGSADHANPALSRAWEYMERHLSGPVRVVDVARHAGVTAVTLHRAFRRSVGVSVHRALTNLRIQRAVSLMAEGDERVKSVAFQCGYPYVHHFIRVFRQHTGLTPGEFIRRGASR